MRLMCQAGVVPGAVLRPWAGCAAEPKPVVARSSSPVFLRRALLLTYSFKNSGSIAALTGIDETYRGPCRGARRPSQAKQRCAEKRIQLQRHVTAAGRERSTQNREVVRRASHVPRYGSQPPCQQNCCATPPPSGNAPHKSRPTPWLAHPSPVLMSETGHQHTLRGLA